MKIDLSNLQYKQFVAFANRASDSDFVQVGAAVEDLRPGELAHHKIVAKSSWDFVGNIGRGKTSRATNDTVRDLFKATILKMCGVSSEEQLPESVRDALKLDKFGKGKPLSARRIRAVDTALKAEIARRSEQAGPLAETLGFKGTSGKTIAGYCLPGSGVQESLSPKDELNERINKNGKSLLQGYALTSTRSVDGNDDLCFNPDDPSVGFKKDFLRGVVVTIDGVTYSSRGAKTNEQKEKAFKEVCDAFVRFVTGDKDAEFATASRAVKIQANVLMSYSAQGLDGVVLSSVGCAFDETQSRSRVSIIGGSNRERKCEFSKDNAGNVKLDYSIKYFEGLTVNLYDEADRPYTMKSLTGSGSYAAELTIGMDKLSKFGNADWDNLAKEDVKRIQKIEHDQEPNWITELDKETHPDYKLEIEDLKISYGIEVNDLRPLGA